MRKALMIFAHLVVGFVRNALMDCFAMSAVLDLRDCNQLSNLERLGITESKKIQFLDKNIQWRTKLQDTDPPVYHSASTLSLSVQTEAQGSITCMKSTMPMLIVL